MNASPRSQVHAFRDQSGAHSLAVDYAIENAADLGDMEPVVGCIDTPEADAYWLRILADAESNLDWQ